jgi:MFS family permease
MGGLLTLNSFKARFPRIDTDNPPPGSDSSTTANVQGITVASYNLGCFFGAIAAIWLGNRLGRRRMMMLGSSIMVVGATLQCTSFHLPQLIVGRIVTGIGNGINTSTVPAWQAETSKSHNRGQIVMIEGAMISGGICLSYWIDVSQPGTWSLL